ncbi:MAG TPA: hypothetical protein VFY73_25450 [Ideonella sp.]|uniref:hypothetical protein n=1 Tax=Ideonella sp. TaxID=1929293 RepID=UPI002E32C806|nr:hypothetical protein [Ideonella sp.]HEX5687376.1 hypothetical protein [Ideonella sp.]
MEKFGWKAVVVGIGAAFWVLTVWLMRYDIEPTAGGAAFLLDRWTGAVYWVTDEVIHRVVEGGTEK